MVVNAGFNTGANATSCIPMIDISSGITKPFSCAALMAPRLIKILAAKTAVGGSGSVKS